MRFIYEGGAIFLFEGLTGILLFVPFCSSRNYLLARFWEVHIVLEVEIYILGFAVLPWLLFRM